jgi:hypothetical protein
MHLDFANALNLVSTVTLIGALVFTGLQVRAANRAVSRNATLCSGLLARRVRTGVMTVHRSVSSGLR